METMPDGRKRVVIENISPQVDGGRFPIKRIVGEPIHVSADIFSDGHQKIDAEILWRQRGEEYWRLVRMEVLGNDRWKGTIIPEVVGILEYTIEAWIDHFSTWQEDINKKFEAGQNVEADLSRGKDLLQEAINTTLHHSEELTRLLDAVGKALSIEEQMKIFLSDELSVLMRRYNPKKYCRRHENPLQALIERKKALFSTWYEMFPRSTSTDKGSAGSFKDCQRIIPRIAEMGFDVLYLPPIHPIGVKNRKGKNNATKALEGDPGSPWAIGSVEGGHDAICPLLGPEEDFRELVQTAKGHGMEVALDIAFQCSPDHPYVKGHPEWFRWRSDGTVQFAENPPKKYEDIIPFDFETEQWEELWKELKRVMLVWVGLGIRIFRVDNPHTKPFVFWEWVIKELKEEYPDLIFLSEAFTRPKVMYRLAKLGFTQSYTYFTWRYTKKEFIDYLKELSSPPIADYFRPNFWPNTPDILPEHLQIGGKSAFLTRLVLAATLSSNYGIYGPAFEHLVNKGLPGTEEYLDSEKYEVKHWDWADPSHIRDFISRVNHIRLENPALQQTRNITFLAINNEHLLAYWKFDESRGNTIIVVVNLDYFRTQAGTIEIPLDDLAISHEEPFLVQNLLNNEKFIWEGPNHEVTLDPSVSTAAIFKVKRRLKREYDFDYFI